MQPLEAAQAGGEDAEEEAAVVVRRGADGGRVHHGGGRGRADGNIVVVLNGRYPIVSGAK